VAYDLENGIREMARARSRNDALSKETMRLADQVVARMREEFGSTLDMETCGKAWVIAASSVVPLCGPEIPAAVVANLIGFAGEQLVREARNG
jgi:hypothetical protein